MRVGQKLTEDTILKFVKFQVFARYDVKESSD